MIRKTSAAAFEEIKQSGMLSERQKQVYALLYERGPLTGNELAAAGNLPGAWKRCSELREMGAVEEVGNKVCSITGRECIAWDVTGEMPHEPKPKPATVGLARVLVLEKRCDQYEDMLSKIRDWCQLKGFKDLAKSIDSKRAAIVMDESA